MVTASGARWTGRVSAAFLPRSGWSSSPHLWSGPRGEGSAAKGPRVGWGRRAKSGWQMGERGQKR